MVWLVALGRTCPAVAELLGSTEDWVRTLIHRDNDQGPAGLVDHRHANPGQRPLVPPAAPAQPGFVTFQLPRELAGWTTKWCIR